jgi:DNA-binding winged helix-turn-helix (wHTH) protein
MTYRFGDFVLSPSRRLLLRDGRELPLIPRYFDLLVLLIQRRHEAVHRRDIFDAIWADVIVSDSALSQAIRTIRRALGDDSREPRFIRTVSRHGYRFVYEDVIEDPADSEPQRPAARPAQLAAPEPAPDEYEALLARLTAPAGGATDDEDRRDAAERLHALGTPEALTRLGTRPGHVRARALLHDTRWDSPGAVGVPLLGAPDSFAIARELVALRLRRAARLVATRWAGASTGGGVAGMIAGGVGGLILAMLPESHAPVGVAPVLAVIGGACGALAGAGVGAGLAVAETATRSRRTLALILFAAAGGGLIGAATQLLGRWFLAALFGMHVPVGGAIEGLIIGGAAGLGYSLATRRVEGGMAAPRGRRRLQTAMVTAALCGLATLAVTTQGRPLVGGTIHAIAREAQGSQVSLAPLGRLLGEPDFGPISQAIIGFGEAALFGLGLTLGLTRRPK